MQETVENQALAEISTPTNLPAQPTKRKKPIKPPSSEIVKLTNDQVATALIRVWLLQALKIANKKLVYEDFEVCGLFKRYVPELNTQDIGSKVWNKRHKELLNEARQYRQSLHAQQNLLLENLEFIRKATSADETEVEVLTFCLICAEYDQLVSLSYFVDGPNQRRSLTTLAEILDVDAKAVARIYDVTSIFQRLNIFSLDAFGLSNPISAVELSKTFILDFYNVKLTDQHIIKQLVDEVPPTDLWVTNFNHMKDDVHLIISHLHKAIRAQRSGTNILLYGPPGTGKTELVKAVAQYFDFKLLAIRSKEPSSEVFLDGEDRLELLMKANELVTKEKCILLFDEASDVFSRNTFGLNIAEKHKAGLNRLLESNAIPTIWITNHIKYMEDSAIRRFDLAIEFKPFSAEQRYEMFKPMLAENTSDKVLNALSKHRDLPVGVIAKAHSVAYPIASDSIERYEAMLKQVINGILKAQKLRLLSFDLPVIEKPKLDFDPSLVNSSLDVETFVQALAENPSARICCHGLPGTGKSLFARYIAERLNKKVMVKTASDILGRYVGESEQNIAEVFVEATARDAVLVIDEIDTFIRARESANTQWQVSLVNEMLVQMESFDGILVATTNMLDSLDAAALRRFDLKLEFKPFTVAQRSQLLQQLAQELLGPDFDAATVAFDVIAESLDGLAAGDAAVLKRQVRFQPLRDFSDLVSRLRAEVALKPSVKSSKSIGFCAAL